MMNGDRRLTELEAVGKCGAFKRRAGILAAVLLAASTLLTGACRETNAGASAQAKELRASDFDPKADTPAAVKVSGDKAFQNLLAFVALGPRYLGSPGHAKAEQFIVNHLDGAQVEQDKFTAATTVGSFPMNNIIAKFPGKKNGIIVLAGHYDTNYPLKDTSFIGANDGGSNVGLMLEIASQLKSHPPDGYSIWLLFTDGEEATKEWTDEDSVYGSKHLAKKWSEDGTAAKIKGFLLLDMIGDKDLHLEHDANSTPWLLDVVWRAAQRSGQQAHLSNRDIPISDDHMPFRGVGIPVADMIDLDYGFDNLYHHTTQDTPDKCSAASLQVAGDIAMETVRALNTR